MKTPLIALILLGLGLTASCTTVEDEPDPLAKPEAFCEAWAENACTDDVVEFCGAKSTTACQNAQTDFCLGILPASYSSKRAQACLDAVKAAYKDAILRPEELAIVIRLTAPCDQLSKGSRIGGQSCSATEECDSASGFSCIKKLGAAEGTCAKPEIIAAGDACDAPSQVCADGYFCNGENCITYKKTGTGTCDGDYQCKPEDHCVKETTDAATGKCQLRAEVSEACSSDADCQSGYCVIESGSAEGSCASTIRLSQAEPLCKNLR